MTVSMILAMVPLGMANSADSSAHVNNVDPEYVLTVDYFDPAGAGVNGNFSATLVVSDDNGENDILTTGYTISWTDEAGTQSASLTEIADTDPLNRTFNGTGAVPYYQDLGDVITVTDDVGGVTDTFTISNEIISFSAADVTFAAADPGATVTTNADVTNDGNNDRSITLITPDVLYGTGSNTDTIPASAITAPSTSTPIMVPDKVPTDTKTLSYSLDVPNVRPDAYSGSITYTVT